MQINKSVAAGRSNTRRGLHQLAIKQQADVMSRPVLRRSLNRQPTVRVVAAIGARDDHHEEDAI